MEVKIVKVGNKYFLDDCIFEFLIGMEMLIEFNQQVNLEEYLYLDEKGIIFNQSNGVSVGILYGLKEGKL